MRLGWGSCLPWSWRGRPADDCWGRGAGPHGARGDFVLLSLFDGIRGCSVALRSLGVAPCADYSSEIERNCQRLIATKFPQCTQLGDVRKLDKAALESFVAKHGRTLPWLVAGGSPCQDLSVRRGNNRKGLLGKKSKLFFEFARVVSMLMSLGVTVAFLLENVASMSDDQRDAITACLGVEPIEIDAARVSACHRVRYYWTNLPVSSPEPRDVDIDALLDDGWRRFPEGKPFRCFVASTVRSARLGREPAGVRRISDGAERAPNADEREAILGFPRGHTRLLDDKGHEVFAEGLRLKLLGNSFSVQVVAHLLRPLAAFAQDGSRPLKLRALHANAWILCMDRVIDGDECGEGDEGLAMLSWQDED